jgi:hypothetical protein
MSCRLRPRSPGWTPGRIRVASTIITLQWLALHRAELDARWQVGAGASGADSGAEPGPEPGEA